MSADLGSSSVASLAIFCPQSKAPTEKYLDQLHAYARNHEHLQTLLIKLQDLREVWDLLAADREDIANLSYGPKYVQGLLEYFKTGKSSRIANPLNGILVLPLLVLVQTCQYFQYLELNGLTHAGLLTQLRAGGGIQGYCGGLLPAIAIALSLDEAEIVENAAKAACLAFAAGAYGDLGDDESATGPGTIVVRTKRPGQADEFVEKFPGVSSLTDI